MIPREKVSGPFTESHTYAIRSRSTSCGAITTTYGSFIKSREYARMSGADLMGFKALKAKGVLLPHTPFQSRKVSSFSTPGLIKVVYLPNGCVIDDRPGYGAGAPIPDPATYVMHDLEPVPDAQRYVQIAAERIYAQGHDTLTFVLEVAKLKQMFLNVVRRLGTLWTTRRFKLSEPGAWLEARYGWRTLLYDLVDLHYALEVFDDQRKLFSERAGTSVSYNRQVVTGEYTNSIYTLRFVQNFAYTISVRGSVSAMLTPPRFGFNPVATAWELIPFSFVVDWLFDVGSAIMAASFMTVAQDYTASTGYRIEEVMTEQTFVLKQNSTTRHGAFGNPRGSTVVDSVRAPSSIPLRPYLGFNVDLLKGLDLIALLRQALTRRK